MSGDIFTMGAWSLQADTINAKGSRNRIHIASIRHKCPGPDNYFGHTLWFHDKTSIAECYCGARVPDEIQGLCSLYNMEWIQGADVNG